MKIQSMEISNYPPIKNLKLDDLGNVVIIAGANGSGKTRLKQAIVQTLQGSVSMSMTLKATRKDEKKEFQNDTIVINQGQQNEILNNYMNSRRFGRGRYVGSLVQIDSHRNIQTTSYQQIKWQVTDPDDQETPGTFYCSDFSGRWQNFMNYIHEKVAAYDGKLSEEVKINPTLRGEEILKKHPHPLEKYKQIFSRLLPGKELQEINPAAPGEFQYRDSPGNILPFNSLSSGEQEVVKVIFDVARKDIKHSIIIVDEPELHLHPTLTFKLIETLKAVGDHTNQFIFLTHSADLISTYYSTGDVYFVDAIQNGANQAHRLSELNHSHKDLVKIIGENLGLFAVGKKLIFVEGENASIDRLTYHSIAQKYLPEAKIVSIGSVENIITLNSVEEQIRNSIFGIDFYMIRDRDGLSDTQIQSIESNGKIRCLKKRHIENYFLDAEILFNVSEKLYITSVNPAITKDFIENELRKIATEMLSINLLQNIKEYLKLNHNFTIPNVNSAGKKDAEIIKAEMIKGAQESVAQLTIDLSQTNLGAWIDEEAAKLNKALLGEEWKDEFHGKIIFSKLCSDVLKEDSLKVRQAYVDVALSEKPEIFNDIINFFELINIE